MCILVFNNIDSKSYSVRLRLVCFGIRKLPERSSKALGDKIAYSFNSEPTIGSYEDFSSTSCSLMVQVRTLRHLLLGFRNMFSPLCQ